MGEKLVRLREQNSGIFYCDELDSDDFPSLLVNDDKKFYCFLETKFRADTLNTEGVILVDENLNAILTFQGDIRCIVKDLLMDGFTITKHDDYSYARNKVLGKWFK